MSKSCGIQCTRSHCQVASACYRYNEWGEPNANYRWGGWGWEIIVWSSRLQRSYQSFWGNLEKMYLILVVKRIQKMSTCFSLPNNLLDNFLKNIWLEFTSLPSQNILSNYSSGKWWKFYTSKNHKEQGGSGLILRGMSWETSKIYSHLVPLL